ncbi:MAG: hypothetical protein DHS20C21_22640 [Gemmatimonadota bacterium]|nr:MAG: hypothetical protein DHS20C21_22640 [Gemmatimonadota bacterium]
MGETTLNGKPRRIQVGCTLAEPLSDLQLDPRWVVAELNGEALSRERFAQAKLAQGDRLELVRPVAGG